MKSPIAQELESVRKRRGGVLRPADVVDFAKDASTALHKCFEWDDEKAGHEYRLEQARRLIRCVVEVVKESIPPIRAYVSLYSDRPGGDSYRRLDDVMRRATLRDELLATALREAQSWRERYERFSELAPIVNAIDKVANRSRRKRRKRRAA